jgi:lipopolysaccharide transport system permease protein
MASETDPLSVTGAVSQTDEIGWRSAHGSQSDVSSRRVRLIGPPRFSAGTVLSGVRTLFQYGDLLYTLSAFRLKVRYKQSVLGWLWAALQPVALMGIYTFVFAHVAKVNTNGDAYPAFVFCGLLPWIFFSGSIASAVHGIVAYPTLLTKMYFPREIIPLSYLAAGLIDFLIASIILTGILAYYRVAPTWNLLYLIPILAVLAAFAASVALFFAAVHVRFRDIGLALPFLLQIWMFATPVVYSMQAVPARVRLIYVLDPVASAIHMFREVVLHGRAPDLQTLGVAAGITIAVLVLAYAYFKASESVMADLV